MKGSDLVIIKPPTRANKKQEIAEGKRMRSLWLQHMMLKRDLVSELDGVEVRNIGGLAGVDYLSPGALTSLLSYVFGPVIDALRKVGYDNGDKIPGVYNLDAAPYDWRIPPQYLEKRDSYMTRTMKKIEKLYSANCNTPVVMVCHSLGCKTGHYFLNYVEENFGRDWIDKHIHTYMPIGAPHLGAPSALRSIVTGEKLGLETFLSDAESLAFGRTIGSGPFLIPSTLPLGAPHNAFLRTEGAIEIWLSPNINVQPLFERRLEGHAPQKLKLVVVYNNKESLSTTWTEVEGDVESSSQTISFGEKFTFTTPPDGPPKNARLTFLLCEPGVRNARASDTMWTRAHRSGRRNFFSVWEYTDCECYHTTRFLLMNYPGSAFVRMIMCCPMIYPVLKFIAWPIFYIVMQIYFGGVYMTFWILFKGSVITFDELSKLRGKASVTAHATLRKSDYYDLGGISTEGMEREVHTVFTKKGGGWCRKKVQIPISIHIRQVSPMETTKNTICSPVCQPSDSSVNNGGKVVILTHAKRDEVEYKPISGFDIISREGVKHVLNAIQKEYDADPLDPRGRTSSDRPPVKRIKAVYGINLPTEVGAVYRRRPAAVDRDDTVLNVHRLDTKARVVDENSGYVTKGGKVLETKNTLQPDGLKISGDGTVPYWSMQHVKTWDGKGCHVEVDTLDGAPHREILADTRFHDLLTSYVCETRSIKEEEEKTKKRVTV
mmetsp:Transcript_42358/g.102062  ORF Transcript_42358/g.102062 Transcript_42358/m.102062 type:complete len:716 (-) Transcript_42358:1589-3736(-)